jgi:general L-amino acid transport system permease protein|tara:strand:- start:660 stop:1844 length:1185 start_codon:yes stop_codon:yes gene_type:complete
MTGNSTSNNRLLRLWYDKESRSVIVQIISLAVILGFFAYLINNAAVNMAAIGKDIDFSFLFNPADYDINQTLIDYSSRSSHFRAGLVGLLNTLLIAAFGIVIATVLGFTLGVMRLSKNWITQKLAYIYIEYMRNVPVLLHILLLYGIIVNVFPKTKQAYNFGDTFFLSNRGLMSPTGTFEPAMWFVVATFVAGIAFTLWFRSYARKTQEQTGKTYPLFWISLAALIVVPSIAYFIAGSPMVWEYPALKGFNFKGGMVIRPEFIALLLALSMYTAAFIGEIVRGGILAVDHGQTEASYALGLSPSRTLSLVVIPQAMRVIIPPLTSQYLNLAKNSSLAIAIGYMDIVATIGGISLNQTGREMESMAIVLSMYLVLSLIISSAMNWYNKRIQLVSR